MPVANHTVCVLADCFIDFHALVFPEFCFPLNDMTCRLQCFQCGTANMFYKLEILIFLDLMPAFGAEQDVCFWSDCLILAFVHFFL